MKISHYGFVIIFIFRLVFVTIFILKPRYWPRVNLYMNMNMNMVPTFMRSHWNVLRNTWVVRSIPSQPSHAPQGARSSKVIYTANNWHFQLKLPSRFRRADNWQTESFPAEFLPFIDFAPPPLENPGSAPCLMNDGYLTVCHSSSHPPLLALKFAIVTKNFKWL